MVEEVMVGLGRLELPTSPLSGVRSSHLSYRPGQTQARMPVSHNWWSWSGSKRRPPECKSGALPAELQPLETRKFSRPIGRGRQAPWLIGKITRRTLSGESETD